MPGAGFPPRKRLRRGREFKRVFRHARRSHDHCFIVLARANDLAEARLGMAISVRQAGNAVTRNRIKRLIRESFRHHQDLLSGLDVVVMGRPGIATQSKDEVNHSLARHWHRLSKRCRNS